MLALRFISVFVGARRASFPRDKRRETHDERNASRNFSFALKAFFLSSYRIKFPPSERIFYGIFLSQTELIDKIMEKHNTV